MNIIIKTPNFIGDTIMMLPALELLKLEYPDAKFTIVCKAHSKSIFRGKGIDNIIIDDTKGRHRFSKTILLIKKIKKSHYTLGVLFHNTFIDALLFKLSNIDTIIGYDKENRKLLLDFWLKIDRSRHYINHYANLVNQYLGNKYTTLPSMKLNTCEQHLISKNSKPLIGFVLGSNKDTRSYPKNMSLELFDIIKNKNFHIVLLGDKADTINNDLYERRLLGGKAEVKNLSGKTTVAQYIDVINTLDLLITIDSSALHIAAATDTDFIALIGKSSSPFCVVKPKVEFGTSLFNANQQIMDEDLIKQIKSIDIIKVIDERFNSAK